MTECGPARRAFAGVFRACVAVAAFVLAGCATPTPAPSAPIGGDSFSGRLALRVEALGSTPSRSFSSSFDLRGDAGTGSLALSTPLGSMLAQARWQPGSVALVTPQGTRGFADLDGLTRDVLGESVPVEAWFDWLHGRPWPGAPSSPAGAGFEQLGWTVDLARLPAGAVAATRRQPPPVVTVRIQLDGA